MPLPEVLLDMNSLSTDTWNNIIGHRQSNFTVCKTPTNPVELALCCLLPAFPWDELMEVRGGRAHAGNVLGGGSEWWVCRKRYGCLTRSATQDFGKVPWFSCTAGSIISPGSEIPFISGCSFLESIKVLFFSENTSSAALWSESWHSVVVNSIISSCITGFYPTLLLVKNVL